MSLLRTAGSIPLRQARFHTPAAAGGGNCSAGGAELGATAMTYPATPRLLRSTEEQLTGHGAGADVVRLRQFDLELLRRVHERVAAAGLRRHVEFGAGRGADQARERDR